MSILFFELLVLFESARPQPIWTTLGFLSWRKYLSA